MSIQLPVTANSLFTEGVKLVFSYSSPRDLMRCRGVNQQWKKLADLFLNQLTIPENLYPIYTRDEFFEKIKTKMSKIGPNELFAFYIELFRDKNEELPSSLVGSFAFSVPQRSSSREIGVKRVKVFQATLDEVSKNRGTNLFSAYGHNEIVHAEIFNTQINVQASNESVPHDFAEKILLVLREQGKAQIKTYFFEKKRKFVTITSFAVALVALYIFTSIFNTIPLRKLNPL